MLSGGRGLTIILVLAFFCSDVCGQSGVVRTSFPDVSHGVAARTRFPDASNAALARTSDFRIASASLDRRLLKSIYSIDQPVFTSAMVLSDRTAYPVFYASIPSIWAGARLLGGHKDNIAAAELSGAWAVASGSALILKHLFKRERPFRSEDGIDARTKYVGGRVIDRFSFPSGHATLAASIVTSTILAYPKWYVIAPGAVWVGTVSVSRVWLGVHYPSDVAAGMVLGTAAGIVSHLVLGDLID